MAQPPEDAERLDVDLEEPPLLPTATVRRITEALLAGVERIAREVNAQGILVYADALPAGKLPLPPDLGARVLYVTRSRLDEESQKERGHRMLRVPQVSLSRFAQVKLAALLALSKGLVGPDDLLLCLTGAPFSGALDTLVILHVGSEFRYFLPTPGHEGEDTDVRPEVLERILNLAVELGREGREGRPVGALFVVGDTERVLGLSRQFILNPFRGYPPAERNVLDPRLEETVKELATIDGAFVVRGDGVIASAGTYLKAAGPTETVLPQGLGARHHAAAAITSLTRAVAVTVSQSTGTVTVFRRGHIVAELEKPRALAVRGPAPTTQAEPGT